MFWIIPGLFEFANWCLSFVDGDEAQVIVVMLILPGKSLTQFSGPHIDAVLSAVIMNVLQFLISTSRRLLSPHR